MKTFFKNSALVMLSSSILWGCTKDEVRAVLAPGGPLTISSSASSIVLVQADASKAALTFTWTPAEFGYSAAVTYTLEICKAGSNFAGNATSTINAGINKLKAFTVGEMNSKLLDIIPFGSAQQLDVRAKADIGSGIAPLYSNVIKVTVTCYKDIVNYSFPFALYIAGNYQGWNPSTAPKIVDKLANTTTNTGSSYEGYINFTDANPAFKVVKGPDWSFGDYGDANSSGASGVLTSTNSKDLKLTSGAGVYRLRANTQALTWSATKITTWGIIGDATPGGWGSSTPMTFNAADGTWTVTANLTGGKEMKFRANNDWGINFGDNTPRDNKPDYDGSNIPVASDGSYTITLDLGVGGNYSYTIRKN